MTGPTAGEESEGGVGMEGGEEVWEKREHVSKGE